MSKSKLARPGRSKRYRAADTSENNKGKGLDAYSSGRPKMSKERKDGKGLTVYLPRKRKPKVAIPKG